MGVLLSLAAALLTERLARRRRTPSSWPACWIAWPSENREMYTEQRSIAQTLQHALLPETLPELDGLEVGARYVPAASGIDVGGDWYDVVDAGDGQVLLMIGDVSGHGLRAATTMASLRHAALAYAAQDHGSGLGARQALGLRQREPARLFRDHVVRADRRRAHRLTVASAGHLPPLLIDGAATGSSWSSTPTSRSGSRATALPTRRDVSVPPNRR